MVGTADFARWARSFRRKRGDFGATPGRIMQRVVQIFRRTPCIVATRAGFEPSTGDFMRCLAQILPDTASLNKKGADIATHPTSFEGLARRFAPRISPFKQRR